MDLTSSTTSSIKSVEHAGKDAGERITTCVACLLIVLLLAGLVLSTTALVFTFLPFAHKQRLMNVKLESDTVTKGLQQSATSQQNMKLMISDIQEMMTTNPTFSG